MAARAASPGRLTAQLCPVGAWRVTLTQAVTNALRTYVADNHAGGGEAREQRELRAVRGAAMRAKGEQRSLEQRLRAARRRACADGGLV